MWGIIAGVIRLSPVATRVSLAEGPSEAIARELLEETGLPQNVIDKPFYLGSMLIPWRRRVKFGWLFESRIDLSDSEREKSLRSKYNLVRGYQPPRSNEIARVQAFSQLQVHELLQTPDRIYKQKFNFKIMQYWLFDMVASKYSPWEGDDFAEKIAIARYGLGRSAAKIFVE